MTTRKMVDKNPSTISGLLNQLKGRKTKTPLQFYFATLDYILKTPSSSCDYDLRNYSEIRGKKNNFARKSAFELNLDDIMQVFL